MRVGVILSSFIFVLFLAGSVSAQGSVTILTSDNAADHAVASVWSEKIGANLVVTPWGSLTLDAVNEVVSSNANVVYVVGGMVAVPDAEEELKEYGLSIIRVGGENREETSLRVSRKFSVTRAVVLDGYDTTALENAVILGKAEGTPIIYLKRDGIEIATELRREGIDEVTFIDNPEIEDGVKNSIKSAGISVYEVKRDMRTAAQSMISSAQEEIETANGLVKNIRDGPSLAGARLLVESEIRLSQAQDFFNQEDYKESFRLAVQSEAAARYSALIYESRFPGSLLQLVSQANQDILDKGITVVKNDLESIGDHSGVELPTPPELDLSVLVVDVFGYEKTNVRGTDLGFDYDIGAKYTKGEGPSARSVNIEVYAHPSDADAITWMEQTQFAGTASRNWEPYTFISYQASLKTITFDASDYTHQEIFLRVAVGRFGVFAKFTESVAKRDAYLLLTNEEQAQLMVEKVSKGIITAIEENT